MNVFDFAMKMEQNGEAYYLKLADQPGPVGIKAIFRQLAGDEPKHYETFKALKAQMTPEMEASTALETAKDVFVELGKDKRDVVDAQGNLDAYRHAMKLEADSYRLYHDAAARESDSQVRELLLRIAGEEQKHFNILQNIYDFVNAPNQYLAWAEFSNLDEFRNFGRE